MVGTVGTVRTVGTWKLQRISGEQGIGGERFNSKQTFQFQSKICEIWVEFFRWKSQAAIDTDVSMYQCVNVLIVVKHIEHKQKQILIRTKLKSIAAAAALNGFHEKFQVTAKVREKSSTKRCVVIYDDFGCRWMDGGGRGKHRSNTEPLYQQM